MTLGCMGTVKLIQAADGTDKPVLVHPVGTPRVVSCRLLSSLVVSCRLLSLRVVSGQVGVTPALLQETTAGGVADHCRW